MHYSFSQCLHYWRHSNSSKWDKQLCGAFLRSEWLCHPGWKIVEPTSFTEPQLSQVLKTTKRPSLTEFTSSDWHCMTLLLGYFSRRSTILQVKLTRKAELSCSFSRLPPRSLLLSSDVSCHLSAHQMRPSFTSGLLRCRDTKGWTCLIQTLHPQPLTVLQQEGVQSSKSLHN